ncbi:unnamed protein product [Prorocentrum cordatum]|uniref:Uncharacterized protein n=2 Tax=Prorocentrum cordatum TaxID=2364126 RepID=A0ABN9RJJ0_9DINO|nr:unnamed protein product [Polarella glacialis]
MKRGFQGFNMRIKQYELYRQDVRDLIGLTVRKMDNYLIVNTLQLGFCITLFTEGRPEPPEHEEGQHVDQEPRWLIGLYALCNGGAFMYYLMSIWLAMHASVAAHAFGVRLLTQFVRLPVPNDQQLDEAVRLAQDYEASGVSDMLRVPLLKQQFQNLARASNDATDAGADGADGGDSDDSASDLGSVGDDETSPVAKLHHVRLYRKLQANWQSYDAYSRVCMALGTNQLLHAISYTCLGQLEETQDGWWPACHCVVVFTTTAWVIARLDLFLSRRFLAFAAILLFLPPALAIVSLYLKNSPKPGMLFVGKCVVPVIYALHIIWIVFTLGIAKAKEREGVALPTNYRSVLYLDVFRWLTRENGEEEPDPDGVGVPSDGAARANRVSSRDENVDFVLVGDGSAGEGRGARTRESVPPQYWRVSLQECLSGCPPLDAELQLWAGEGVRAQLRLDDPPAVERADRLRERLQRLRAELDRLAAAAAPPGAGAGPAGCSSSSSAGGRRRPPPERQAPQAPPPAAGPGSPAVWLLVQQQRGGRAVRQYYLNSITRERSSEQPAGPAGPAPVSTLADLEQRLDCLEDFAARLRPPGAASSSSSPASAAPRIDRSGLAGGLGRGHAAAGRGAHRHDDGARGHGGLRCRLRAAERASGAAPPAQAARVHTLEHGGAGESCVLMLAWASGLVASIHRVWEHKDREERFAALAAVGVALGESAEAPPLLAAPAALPAAWPPHAFFRWGGLACHPGLAGGTAEGGPRLLAAEKYAVHELRLHASTAGMQSMESGGSLAEAVRRCLDQALSGPRHADPHAAGASCEDAQPGSACYGAVAWLRQEGFDRHPEWYPEYGSTNTFREVQDMLHRLGKSSCPRPCLSIPEEEEGSSEDGEVIELEDGGRQVQSRAHRLATSEGCHDAAEGEWCHKSIAWLQEKGLAKHPDWYPELSPRSSRYEIQRKLHAEGKSDCPRPCEGLPEPVPREPPAREESSGDCHDALPDSRCYTAVAYGLAEGLAKHPEVYPGLLTTASFKQVQESLYLQDRFGCERPCPEPAAPRRARWVDEPRIEQRATPTRVQDMSEDQLRSYLDGDWNGVPSTSFNVPYADQGTSTFAKALHRSTTEPLVLPTQPPAAQEADPAISQEELPELDAAPAGAMEATHAAEAEEASTTAPGQTAASEVGLVDLEPLPMLLGAEGRNEASVAVDSLGAEEAGLAPAVLDEQSGTASGEPQLDNAAVEEPQPSSATEDAPAAAAEASEPQQPHADAEETPEEMARRLQLQKELVSNAELH